MGAPLDAGTWAASGAVSGYLLSDPVEQAMSATDAASALEAAERFFPQEGDPGVAHPSTGLEFAGRVGVTPLLELGLHGAYSDAAWASRGFGVLEIPDGGALWGLGAQATLGRRWGGFGLGGTLDATVWSMPYARWTYSGPDEYAGGYAVGDASEWYTLEQQDRVGALVVSGTVGTSYRVGVFDSAVGFGVVPNLSNRGFTDAPADPAEWRGLSVVPTVDLGLWLKPVRVGVQGWYASGARAATDKLATGLGARAQVELRGSLRRADRAESPRARDP